MVFQGSKIKVLDNSGARVVRCIRVSGVNTKVVMCAGDRCVVSVRSYFPNRKVKKGGLFTAVVVSCKKEDVRACGSYVSFFTNRVVLLKKNELFQPFGTRVIGVVSHRLRLLGFSRIVALSSMVI